MPNSMSLRSQMLYGKAKIKMLSKIKNKKSKFGKLGSNLTSKKDLSMKGC